jgi:hypothetical protein
MCVKDLATPIERKNGNDSDLAWSLESRCSFWCCLETLVVKDSCSLRHCAKANPNEMSCKSEKQTRPLLVWRLTRLKV